MAAWWGCTRQHLILGLWGWLLFSGFTPMRTDTDQKSTGGIRRLWEWHHVLPKLGLYHDTETEIAYDYEDLIKMISPRNILIYSPKNDRFADTETINNCVEKIQLESQNKDYLEYKNPDDFSRFQKDQEDVVMEWLRNKIK